ncbi:hypothetical protein [Paracoccus indicus]|uniref:AbiU2 domain-containing protein n=1 Tax=Paracoccus indicus TaxID=2079229 RepID=UPI000D3B5099|nr:hypothetical protein [Paracoccus indicus]
MDRPWERLDELTGREAAKAVGDYCLEHLLYLKGQQRIYWGLYGDERRIEVLNTASGPVAKIVQDALFDVIVLGICRLLDPAQSVKKSENLTLALLIDMLPIPDRKDEYHSERRRLRDDAAALVDRRNKHIAHADSAALKKDARVGWVSMRQIKSALDDMYDLLRRIYKSEFNTETYGWKSNDHPELQFLRALAFGNAAHAQKLEDYEEALITTPYGESLPDLEDIYPDWLRTPRG